MKIDGAERIRLRIKLLESTIGNLMTTRREKADVRLRMEEAQICLEMVEKFTPSSDDVSEDDIEKLVYRFKLMYNLLVEAQAEMLVAGNFESITDKITNVLNVWGEEDS